jgi:hypothetical protein
MFFGKLFEKDNMVTLAKLTGGKIGALYVLNFWLVSTGFSRTVLLYTKKKLSKCEILSGWFEDSGNLVW